jgi:hypothetical protein
MYDSLKEPFALYAREESRKDAALRVASFIGPQTLAEAIQAFEPYVPWEEGLLRLRAATYRTVGHRLADRAERELQQFLRDAPQEFSLSR